ncbi:MAG: pyruvate kinase [Nitrospirae bacterium]|nr:pyruvate kinase [Nitrospirota bacterium]
MARMTRIVATVGPSSSSHPMLRKLVDAGVDVFRLNFSHGLREDHCRVIGDIRRVCKEARRDVAVLQDLGGPKIRTGMMKDGEITLETGAATTITTRNLVGTPEQFSTSYNKLPRDVGIGDPVLLNDGAIALEVVSIAGSEINCHVVRGGALRDRKGMNLPKTSISAPSVTPKDILDLRAGLDAGVDYVALSFVRRVDDVLAVRKMLDKRRSGAHLIAKMEKPEAIANMKAVIEAAHGIMVARGDLGVEMEAEKVPFIQKNLIHQANRAGRCVITATQMLESMVSNPTPTRAEVSDVANAIIDGTDAVMLSAETSVGRYAVEAVLAMDRIALETEAYLSGHDYFREHRGVNPDHPVYDSLGRATRRLCEDLGVPAIAAFTESGETALFLSKSRPAAPIFAFTANETAFRRMRLYRGVTPIMVGVRFGSRAEMRNHARRFFLKSGLAGSDSRPFLFVAGAGRPGEAGTTSTIEIVPQ